MGLTRTHWGILFLVAGALATVLSAPAVAAEPSADDAAALAELRALMKIEPPTTTPEETRKALDALLPKIEALAEKHSKREAGALALVLTAQMAMRLEKHDRASAALQKFLERFPTHALVQDARLLAAVVKYEQRDYDGARQALTAHLKQYPAYAGKARVEALLAKISLIGTDAKDFKTKDLAGKDVKLSDFRGKVVLLDFFAGWCAPCRAETPNLVKAYGKYRARGFEIIGVSLDRTAEDAAAYVKKEGIQWTVTFEEPGHWASPVAKLYGIESIPAMYLVDKAGKVLDTEVRGERLERRLAELFPEKEEPK